MGLTIEAIAREFNVSKPTWSTWELGTREPKLDVISAICVRLKCTPNDLLGVASQREITTGDNSAVAIGSNAQASVSFGEAPACSRCPYKKRLAKIEKMLGK